MIAQSEVRVFWPPISAPPRVERGRTGWDRPGLFMNELMQNLFELQTLEFGEKVLTNSDERIEELRAKIPLPILGHYDRLGDRGKKGVSICRNETCTACHMKVPRGVVIQLMHGSDVCLCGSCGRYLYLPPQPAPAVPAPKKTARLATV